jgi:rhodanese-related sulfurtransferase
MLMNLIDREELKERLDNRDDITLVMVLSEWAYRAKHIPGSLHFLTTGEALKALDPDEEIVLYDSNPMCPASRMACNFLEARGFKRVRRYAGGLEDWEDAGYPLEGRLVA